MLLFIIMAKTPFNPNCFTISFHPIYFSQKTLSILFPKSSDFTFININIIQQSVIYIIIRKKSFFIF